MAFLSPCISKTVEFKDDNTHGYVEYNVTYKMLLKYLKTHNIDLKGYEEEFDNVQGAFGVSFSRPGGLKENVRFYVGDDIWIKQVEGIEESILYLEDYWKRINDGLKVPALVDVLNCREGCNKGTATNKNLQLDEIDLRTNEMLSDVEKKRQKNYLKNSMRSLI